MAATYTASATSTGEGRAGGEVVSSDGQLELRLAVPTEMGGPGGGTNPEQLFAAGWSACFHSALKGVAKAMKADMRDSAVVADISLLPLEERQGYTIGATLHVEMAGVDQERAEALVEAAHLVCPYSNATRGNIDVQFAVSVA